MCKKASVMALLSSLSTAKYALAPVLWARASNPVSALSEIATVNIVTPESNTWSVISKQENK